MSGVKWDRDLGKEFESGASEIKRHPKLKWKSAQLGGSHNFSRYHGASVRNKYLGKNECRKPSDTV
jgi:hypothetical protein